MKLQIKFFADLYNFLIADYPLQLNEKNNIKLPYFLFKNTVEVNFILQNIHILDLPELKLSRVQAVKDILKLYLLKFDKLNINIPKFEYHVKADEFLEQKIIQKILQPPIKELDTSYVLFKNYSLQELKTLIDKSYNILFFNFKLLNFVNQFFCVDYSKINYCILDIGNRFYDEEDLKILLDTEIDIELNYIDPINSYKCKNFENFINSPKVIYNRFLVLYHESFKNFKINELNILFNICSDDYHLAESLISRSNYLTLEKCTDNIKTVLDKYKPSKPLKTLIHVVPNYKKFLILYKDLFDNKLILKQSDLLLNICNNNNDLLKSLTSNLYPLALEEKFNIITNVLNKYENDELISRLIIQLINLISYHKVQFNSDILSTINFYLQHLSGDGNTLPINLYYPDGIPFESNSKYCKLLGEEHHL